MRKVAAIACAGALAFTLAGCGGGGSSLDRTVIVGDLSLKVPSSWSEEDMAQTYEEKGLPSDDCFIDNVVYKSEDGKGSIQVVHEVKDDNNSRSQRSLESEKSIMIEHGGAESVDYDLVSSEMKDDVLVDVYDVVAVFPEQTQSIRKVFAYDGDEVYMLTISKVGLDADAVTKSISIQ